jgi:hypothetical protein
MALLSFADSTPRAYTGSRRATPPPYFNNGRDIPDGDREITVQWESDDLGEIDVRIPLTPADYLRAVEAHGKGREVSISGTLERRGRLWVLTSLSEFTDA